jgi:putative ABC transport system permease protein
VGRQQDIKHEYAAVLAQPLHTQLPGKVMYMRSVLAVSMDVALAGIAKHPTRSVLTALCVSAAFALFGVLQGINDTFDGAIAGLETISRQLFVTSKVSRTDPLPISHLAQIEAIPGVEAAVQTAFLLGYFREEKNWVNGFAVDMDKELAVFNEFRADSDALARIRELKTGAIIGRGLADRYGWKAGDRVPLTSLVWETPEGSYTWEFDIVGIYDAPDPRTTQAFLLRYDYFDERRTMGKGTVSSFAVRVRSADEAKPVAQRIDAAFANSAGETVTQSGREMYFNRIRQLGDVKLMVRSVLTATLLLMLFVITNTIRQSADERMWEFGVLQSLGFSRANVISLVVIEALTLAAAGAVVGVAAASVLISVVPEEFGEFALPVATLTKAALIAIAVAVVSALQPGWRILRLPIVNALRRA